MLCMSDIYNNNTSVDIQNRRDIYSVFRFNTIFSNSWQENKIKIHTTKKTNSPVSLFKRALKLVLKIVIWQISLTRVIIKMPTNTILSG